MVNRASNVYGTGPEPTTKCTSPLLFQYDQPRQPGDINLYAYTLSSTEFSIMSGVARRETLHPDTATESVFS